MTQGKLIAVLVLITLICLSLSALILPGSPTHGGAPVRLVTAAPSQISSVEVREGDATPDRLTREGPDAWTIELGSNQSAPAIRWPADLERVRGFLRILDRLRAEPSPEPPKDDPTVQVRIEADSGAVCTLGLPSSSIAGRSVVMRSEGGEAATPFFTTDELSRLLTGGGLRNWLDTRAFAGAEGQTSEFRVDSAGTEMVFRRLPGGWRLVAPFEASAETSLVEELLQTLLTLPVTPVPGLATGNPEQGGSPTTISITTQRREVSAAGEVAATLRTSVLRTIGPVGATGVVPAVAGAAAPDGSGPQIGPLAVEINAERLSRAVRKPDFYLARRVLRAAPSDIRGITIEPPAGIATKWTRGPTGWSGAGGAAGEADAKGLDGLVDLLTQRDAPLTAWVGEDWPDGGQILATIRCTGLGDATIATVRLGVAPAPAGSTDKRMQALLVAEGAGRFYTPESTVDVVRWVAPPPPKQ